MQCDQARLGNKGHWRVRCLRTGCEFEALQTLPLSYYDCTPLGNTISRCTADVETVPTLFTTAAAGGAVASSGGGPGGTSGATVLVGVVRLGTIAAAMLALSP